MISKKGKKVLKLEGKSFNRWKVLSFNGYYIRKTGCRESLWLCECICGTIRSVRGTSLKNGGSKSCGCLVIDVSKEIGKRRSRIDGAFKDLISVYKRRAIKKNINFTLTDEDFKEFTSSNCYYCNKEPSNLRISQSKININAKNYLFNGIDRLDSLKGYEKSNCVTCCFNCNVMKFTNSYKDFINHIIEIYNHLNLKELNKEVLNK